MSPQSRQYVRFAVAICVMLVGVVYLAFTGVRESKSYYITIPELRAQAAQGDDVYSKRLRVAGDVLPGSIKRYGTRVDFVLKEANHNLAVVYQGTEAPPDTFKDDSQALAEGSFGRDGIFHAKTLQAKCASKYAPAPGQGSGATQPAPQNTKPATSTRQ